MNRLGILLQTIFSLSLLLSCESLTSSGDNFTPQDNNTIRKEISAVILDNGKTPDDYVIDQYTVVESIITNDTLYFNVTYSGGCNEHDFGLVANNYFMESFPVQVNLLLYHDAHNDACDAIISKEFIFDLTPLKNEYLNFYGNNTDPIILNVLVSKETNEYLRFTYNAQDVYYNSFEADDDASGWSGITADMLVEEHSPRGGNKSLYIGGGCLQPAASIKLIIREEGNYIISCWGKTNYYGGNIILKKSEHDEISIYISNKEWAFCQSNSSLHCDAGTEVSLEFWVGGIIYDDLFCDELKIIKM